MPEFASQHLPAGRSADDFPPEHRGLLVWLPWWMPLWVLAVSCVGLVVIGVAMLMVLRLPI